MFLCLQASFVATGNRTDISLEDPDFWQKWAKKAELDLDAINGRVLHTEAHTTSRIGISPYIQTTRRCWESLGPGITHFAVEGCLLVNDIGPKVPTWPQNYKISL